jgi:hypothetical protein
MDPLTESPPDRSFDAEHSDASFFAGGWKAYIPPPLRSNEGLLRYYLAVLPVALPAGVLLALGGNYTTYGVYLTVGLFVVVSAAYTVWLVRTMPSKEDTASSSASPGARDDRSRSRSRPREAGGTEGFGQRGVNS